MAESSVNADAYRALHADKKEDFLKLYGSWFCPFVQRSWITLEEKKVEYQYIEIDPYAKVSRLSKTVKVCGFRKCQNKLETIAVPKCPF